jgi:RNA polymerase sigma factor (sigma-70 family)
MIDNKALSDIYDRHNRELFVYICGFTGSPETAEDLLHDAFVRLIRYSQQYPIDESNIRAFLYRTARNLCIDLARRDRKMSFSPLEENLESGGSNTMEDDLEYRELRRKVQSLISDKDPISRSVFLMRTELAMQYQDIAKNLGISERTAKRKMGAMLEYLAESLEKSGFKLMMLILMALLAFLFVIYY